MTDAASLTVCYAARQTGGNKDGDFVALGAVFVQQQPLTFSPLRIVTGAAQVMNLNQTADGDQLKFTQSASIAGCSADLMGAAAAPNASAVYDLSASSQSITLHDYARNGTWKVCYKPAGGLWTYVPYKQFSVIPKPTFSLFQGLAGSATPLVFSGAQDGDFIVLKENDCANAHSVVSGIAARSVQLITNSSVSTTITMTKETTVLKVCYAPVESGGDSADDYTTLAAEWTQLKRPAFAPIRTVSGATQLPCYRSCWKSQEPYCHSPPCPIAGLLALGV